MSDLKFLLKAPFAHRGLFNNKNGIPENSIIAFEKAIEEKYPIEIDVHLLEDGNVVVFHDDDLSRMTGVKKKIKYCTYDEIKNLKLNNTKYGIPLLKEVLDLVDGKVPLLIELKYDRKAGEAEQELMKILKNYKGKFAVQSFSPKSLIWFKNNYPEVPRGQLSAGFEKDKWCYLKKYILRNVCLNFLTKPDFISYAITAFPNKRIENFRKSGKVVLAWTIRNKEDFEKSKKYCDNIIGEKFENYL